MDRRIFYYCYDHTHPAGGEKENYQHVDILTRNGYEAYVTHTTRNFRLTWFDNSTPVAHWPIPDFNLTRDIVVVPENLGSTISLVPGHKVIFNKGVVSGFTSLGLSPSAHNTYLSTDIIGILTVSDHNRRYLEYSYPSKPVYLVRPNIRPDLFTWTPLAAKRLQIAYAAKARSHGRTLYQMLRSRAACNLNNLGLIQWLPIADLHESVVITTLRDSLLFVFLSVDEGLGRLPIEAMACGCIVLAYDAGPLPEYLQAVYRYQYGDILSMAQAIEAIIAGLPSSLRPYVEVSRRAREIAEMYSNEEQTRSVLDAWNRILARMP